MEKKLNPNNAIFALDIGTNSVVGILGTSCEQRFIITHSVVKYHRKRSMVDGQIHDIPSVLKIVKEVKQELEEKAGFTLKQVSIAAAGRALKTMKLSESISLNQNSEISTNQIKLLEFEALKKAHESVNAIQENEVRYFCVGHSLTKFIVDELDIANPIGQKGKVLTGHLIATFLPEIVVESLHTVMTKAGLEVESMTLEPIAALDAIVPENIRLLNIALVDIGAGTSDIAITKEDTIVGYGMTDMAGDEVTEEIAKAFLLDFNQAEALKCKLRPEKEYSITNILGETTTVSFEQVLEMIQEKIDSIAGKIAQEIIGINEKAVSAIFLVGGGSQIAGIAERIVYHLKLPDNRVVIKTINDIEGFIIGEQTITGPEAITPFGIFKKAITDYREDFIEVTVNHKRIKMFHRKNLKIGDALALAQVDPKVFIPQEPKEITIILEGKEQQLLYSEGQKASIYLNDELAGIGSAVKNGDRIHIETRLSDPFAMHSLKSLLPARLHQGYNYFVNDQKTTLETKVRVSDRIALYKKKGKNLQETGDINRQRELNVFVNKTPIKISTQKWPVVFTEVFDYIDFDRKTAKGKLVMKLNGKRAGFLDELKEGDHLEIYWT